MSRSSKESAADASGAAAHPEARRALSAFAIGTDALPPQIAPIERGLIHRTYRVEQGGRRYVLQQLNPMFAPGIHENIAAVTERLRERGVTTPMLVRTADGSLFAEPDPGERWRLLTFASGVSFNTCPSPEAARSAGALVGRFHTALCDLSHEFRPLGFTFHDMSQHLADLERALREHTGHRLHAEVAQLANSVRAITDSWTPLGELPDRVVHLDLKFNNVLFAEGEAPGSERADCLIDLDTLSRRPLWIELGDAWRSWCNRQREHEPEARLDLAIFEASAEGWLSTAELDLSRPERISLALGLERIAVELCSRFAADALEERYFGWNEELFESSGEHNLARARGQLSLHAQARATRDERLRFLLG